MPAFRIENFSGLVPRLDSRSLAPNQAQSAFNCKLTNGDIVPLKGALYVTKPLKAGTPQTIYRMVDSGGAERWLTWPKVVDVVKGPVAGDTLQRIYYTGDNEPRMTTIADAITGLGNDYPKQFYVLGVHAPITVPTVNPTGGTGASTSRAYLYTFVAKFSDGSTEESAPCAATAVITGKVDSTWAVSGMDAAPPNSVAIVGAVHSSGTITVDTGTVKHFLRAGEEHTISGVVGMTDLNGTWLVASTPDNTHFTITKTTAQTYTSGGTVTRVAPHNTANMVKRLYRTVTGTSGTNYQMVVELPVATTSYNDTILDANLSTWVLPSLTWDMPPTDMHSIVALPGGILAGVSKNELCFSEPWRPHAWPVNYRQATAYKGVALGVFGNSVVVATEGNPEIATGSHPSSMTLTRNEGNYPCVSKRGTISTGYGVEYPSHDGMVRVSPAGTELLTRAVYTRDEWKKLNAAGLFSADHNDRYYGAYTDSTGSPKLLILDRNEQAAVIESNVPITALYRDPIDGNLYVVQNGEIRKWDSDDAAKLLFGWMSKEFLFAPPLNMAAAKVEAFFSTSPAEIAALQAARDAVLAANQALLANSDNVNGALASTPWNTYAFGNSAIQPQPPLTYEYLQFTLYADNTAVFSTQVTSSDAFRLPSGYKIDNLAVSLSGNVTVRSVVVGSSMIALREA